MESTVHPVKTKIGKHHRFINPATQTPSKPEQPALLIQPSDLKSLKKMHVADGGFILSINAQWIAL
jgi:hypothetical protein